MEHRRLGLCWLGALALAFGGWTASVVFADDRGDEALFYFAGIPAHRELKAWRDELLSAGVEVLGIAPENKFILRATTSQLTSAIRRGILSDVEPIVVKAPERTEEPPGRGLGAKRVTREEWDVIAKTLTKIETVAPNELAKTRSLLNGGPPAAVDNSVSQYFPPIRSQGAQGSCTAWAAGYYFNTYLQARESGWQVSGGNNAYICSPAFLYPLENGGMDDGAYTHSVMQRLNEVGCASWAILPYNVSDYTTWPDEAQWTEALPRRTLQTFVIGDAVLHGCSASEFAAIKQLLVNGEILVTDTDVHSTWYNYYPQNANGINNAVLFAIDGDYIGGHAMTIVGYDDTRTYFDGTTTQTGAFLLANSWGSWWGASNTVGQRGFIWVAYALFTNYNGYFGVAYYNSDRTNYTPRLWAAAGLYHAKRGYVRYRGGVGSSSNSLWFSPSVISNDGGTAIAIEDNRRVVADLTDGMSFITNVHLVELFAEMRVRAGAGSAGTLASAHFYYDFWTNDWLGVVAATNTPLTVNQNSTRFATRVFDGSPLEGVELTVTNPTDGLVVSYTTSLITVQGTSSTNATGHLLWTNLANGAAGGQEVASEWAVFDIPLEYGTNLIAFCASNSLAPPQLAWDVPTNAWYTNGWHTGDNGGYGWGTWSLIGGANAGHFIATRTSNTNLDIAPTAWGLWANSGDTASGTRFLARPLVPGDRMELKFENHWIDSGKSVGIAWRNILGEYLLEFLFVGGGTNYLINDSITSRPTGIPFRQDGFAIELTLLSSNTYRLKVDDAVFTGTLKSRTPMEIRQFHCWNFSAGNGPNYDVFLADLAVWGPPGPGVSTSVAITVIRSFPTYLIWEVRSEWGEPTPPVGIYTALVGTVITSAINRFDTYDRTQYECVGWQLAGVEPQSGTSNIVVFSLTNDAVLTWLWVTNYALAVSAGPCGAVSLTGGWYRSGSTVEVSAIADSYYHFVQWTGEVPLEVSSDNPVQLVMDQPRRIYAEFAPDLTERGVPHWWLASYGWTNDFDEIQELDADGDGMPTWQEWIALTDPTDVADVLAARVASFGPEGYVIEWPGRSNRIYWISVHTGVNSAAEAILGPISGPQSQYTDVVYHVLSPVLYRVGVHR